MSLVNSLQTLSWFMGTAKCMDLVLLLLVSLVLSNQQSTISSVDGGARTVTLLSDADALQNVSRTIENLLQGYDIRLRPQFGGKCQKSIIS